MSGRFKEAAKLLRAQLEKKKDSLHFRVCPGAAWGTGADGDRGSRQCCCADRATMTLRSAWQTRSAGASWMRTLGLRLHHKLAGTCSCSTS